MPCAIWNSLFVPIALAATINLAGVAHAQGRPHSAPPFSGPSSPTAVPATNRTDPERAAKDRCPNGRSTNVAIDGRAASNWCRAVPVTDSARVAVNAHGIRPPLLG